MEISDHSRVWIYQANRELTPVEQKLITGQLDEFISGWQAHGNQLLAKAEIRYNRFIIISVDERQANVTGCSIDKSVALMKQFETDFNISLFDRFQLAYRDGDELKCCNRNQFETLVANGAITSQTIVFNNLVTNRAELRSKWEVPFAQSWHSSVFSPVLS